MAIYFPENEIPDKARTNKLLRVPIILGALLSVLFGRNTMGINDEIRKYDWDCDISKWYNLLKLKLRMTYYRYAYEFMFSEFVSYDFEHKTKKECLKYVSSYERVRLYNELFVDTPEWDIFRNKKNTYEMYSKFYKRDVIFVESLQNLGEFSLFVNKHHRFIVKPPTENNGRGIFFVDLDNDNIKAMEVFNKCVGMKGALIEECINQCGIINQLYPSSVNTVRFITYYNGEKNHHITAFLRMGVNGSVVDNSSQGGLSAGIDLKTGRIISHGHRADTKRTFENHPDTEVKIKGIQIPDWNSLLEMIDEIVKVCPQQSFVGWDFAYSDKGWVLVEANGGPGIFAAQMSNEKGLRDVFSETVFNDSKNANEYKSARL